MDQEHLDRLIESMDLNGFMPNQPLVVTDLGGGHFNLENGWYRCQAAKIVGIEEVWIKVLVMEDSDSDINSEWPDDE